MRKFSYKIRVHKNEVRFSVLKWVADSLGLKGGDLICITVTHRNTGAILFKGTTKMRSGLEIYGPELRVSKLKKGQAITVHAWVPSSDRG